MNYKQVLEDLKAARGELVKRRWAQGHYEGVDGDVCMLGAGLKVIPLRSYDIPPNVSEEVRKRWEEFDQILIQHLPAGYLSVPGFNDTPWRTKEECIKVYDKAIEYVQGVVDKERAWEDAQPVAIDLGVKLEIKEKV